MEKWFLTLVALYLAVMAVWDIRRKEIPVLPGIAVLFVLLGFQIFVNHAWFHGLSGLLVGGFLWMAGRLSRGGVGEGDALVYLVLGAALGFFQAMEVLAVSLMLSSVLSGFLLVFRHVGRKYAIPFIPFTVAAYGLVMLM